MQVIRHTTAQIGSTTVGHVLRGMLLFAGGPVVVFDGAGRELMGLPAPGSVMLDSPIPVMGLSSGGTVTDLYIYVE